ncbi:MULTISPECIES: GNAT family N-acetyltransferase [Sphingomonas]|uniref:GNAT family N-acetyltransferase n=1 Tax=Sphingomonas TaxID=13687 RepID=UPI001445D48C|nr:MULTISPECIES: GNAT family N-acetyltransferase [Sphingomonas]
MTQRSAPTLETERLRLRAFGADDLPQLAALWADPLVTQFVGGRPLSEEESWRKALAGTAQWGLFGFGYWIVTDRDDRLVGHMGFADFRRGIDPAMDGAPELGYVFASATHGKGMAGEACRAALDWLDRELGQESWAIISPGNAPSLKLADRLGFARVGQVDYHGETVLLKRPAA